MKSCQYISLIVNNLIKIHEIRKRPIDHYATQIISHYDSSVLYHSRFPVLHTCVIPLFMC